MKVAVHYTVEVPDWYRRAIRRYYGSAGLATRAEIRAWFEQFGTSMDDELARDEDTNERLAKGER